MKGYNDKSRLTSNFTTRVDASVDLNTALRRCLRAITNIELIVVWLHWALGMSYAECDRIVCVGRKKTSKQLFYSAMHKLKLEYKRVFTTTQEA
jgi:hypothetical protein